MDDRPDPEADAILSEVRQQTFERDAYRCQRCRETNDSLEIHRLVEQSEHEGSEQEAQFITLCRTCHAVMHPDDDSVGRAREQAPLFPHPDAPETVSRMRTPEDHVCWDCESEIEDPADLSSYDLAGETLILCTDCELELYGYTGFRDLNGTADSTDRSSDQNTDSTATEPATGNSTDSGNDPISFILFGNLLDVVTTVPDVNEADGDYNLHAKFLNFFLSSVSIWLVSSTIFYVFTQPSFAATTPSPKVYLQLLLIVGFLMLFVDALSDLDAKRGAIRLGWAIVFSGMVGTFVFTGGLFTKIVLWHTIGSPVVSVIETVIAVSSTAAPAILGVVGVGVVSLLFSSWRTGSAINWHLTLRMILSLFLLMGLTAVFFTAIWRLIETTVWVPMMILGVDAKTQQVNTNVIGIWLLIGFVYHELVPIIDAKPETAAVKAPEALPTIHTITNRIAAQLDIPVPTIAVTPKSGVETITWGYRPGNMTLILSKGTIDMLDEEELEAVIAHELAHIANMDAIVMTIASLPALLAGGLLHRAQQMIITRETAEPAGTTNQSRTETDFSLIRSILWVITIIPFIIVGGIVLIFSLIFSVLRVGPPHHIVAYALMVVGGLMKCLCRPLVSILSRSREIVADRTATRVTSSPAALASALTTLDGQTTSSPETDLRERSELATMSILPRESWGPITHSPSENADWITAGVIHVERSILELFQFLLNTHPSTERRIAALQDLKAEQS